MQDNDAAGSPNDEPDASASTTEDDGPHSEAAPKPDEAAEQPAAEQREGWHCYRVLDRFEPGRYLSGCARTLDTCNWYLDGMKHLGEPQPCRPQERAACFRVLLIATDIDAPRCHDSMMQCQQLRELAVANPEVRVLNDCQILD
ncbi:MAG: hypothetical protein AAGC55_26580 [Myxococcota bacterium]